MNGHVNKTFTLDENVNVGENFTPAKYYFSSNSYLLDTFYFSFVSKFRACSRQTAYFIDAIDVWKCLLVLNFLIKNEWAIENKNMFENDFL